MIRRTVHTVSTSNADDAAFGALADASKMLDGASDARIVGGQMVALLLAAFPTPDAIIRRTADADLAISTTLATAGTLHDQLTAAGYEATAGNSYAKQDQTIDLLVPSRAGTFTRAEHGGRTFDAAPGLSLALAADPIELDVTVILRDGSALRLNTRLPTPEIATVLKAYASRSRAAVKDAVDLHNLLSIADAHPPTEIGGWSLTEPALSGSRRDAARILNALATRARRDPTLRASGVNPARLSALIQRHVAPQ